MMVCSAETRNDTPADGRCATPGRVKGLKMRGSLADPPCDDRCFPAIGSKKQEFSPEVKIVSPSTFHSFASEYRILPRPLKWNARVRLVPNVRVRHSLTSHFAACGPAI